jgi:hypothetical protein
MLIAFLISYCYITAGMAATRAFLAATGKTLVFSLEVSPVTSKPQPARVESKRLCDANRLLTAPEVFFDIAPVEADFEKIAAGWKDQTCG